MAETKAKKGISVTTQILAATVGGIVFGSLVGPWAGNLKFIGDIFIRLIQMSVVLLVMTSVSVSVGSVEGKGIGRMGFNTFKWFIVLTVFAASLGLFLGNLIRPGQGITIVDAAEIGAAVEPMSIQDTLLGFFSTNIISSMANGSMIPCIIFAVFFGLAMGTYTAQSGNPHMRDWIKGFNAIIMNIIKMVMKIAPIGVFCLLANVAGAIGFKVIIPMFKFLLCLALGDLIMLVLYIPMTGALCKVNPMKIPGKLVRVSLMALTTTSSAICLPTKMEDSVTKFGISRRVSDFVGPLSMSMNSNGAAMCNVIAVCFMSQATGVVLSPYQMVMAIALSCMLCMGTIVVPGGNVITLTFLATSLGLPLEAIALLVGIDWFSGMFRTLMNVDVDILVAMLVANREGELDREVYNGEKEVQYA